MNEGQRRKKKLWSEQGRAELEKLSLAPWAGRRRRELLELLDRLNPTIEELTAAAEQEAQKRPDVLRLRTSAFFEAHMQAIAQPAQTLENAFRFRFHNAFHHYLAHGI